MSDYTFEISFCCHCFSTDMKKFRWHCEHHATPRANVGRGRGSFQFTGEDLFTRYSVITMVERGVHARGDLTNGEGLPLFPLWKALIPRRLRDPLTIVTRDIKTLDGLAQAVR